jgi:3-oxoadipate enol-lactonase
MGTARVALASGLTVSYREAGDGPTIVQVHGLGTGHRNYDLLTPHLERTLHVFDIDLPGYGESDAPLEPRTIREYSEDVAQFIGALGYERVHIHGTSMGGCIAMTLAGRFPELVDRLVVTCSFARLDRAAHIVHATWRAAAELGGIEALALVTSQQGFSRSFWDRSESADTQAAFVDALSSTTPEDFLRDLAAMKDLDLGSEVTRIRAPTLLLGADEDIITPVQAARSGLGMTDLERLIPNARLQVFEQCGHFISIERPTDTAAAISDFVLGDV